MAAEETEEGGGAAEEEAGTEGTGAPLDAGGWAQ